MPLLKKRIKKATKPHNESSSGYEDKRTTYNKHPKPKYDKPDVARHFLDFYSDCE